MFVLLKVLLFFFRPLIWIIILFAFGFVLKNPKHKRRLFRSAFALLIIFSNPFIIRKCIQLYETPAVSMASLPKYNTGILLGGLVSYNRYDDRGYFNNAADRFIETSLLYKTGHIQNIIIAAGNGYITKNNFSEADYLKQRMVELGIPPDHIFLDTKSRNTLENARFSKAIVDSLHVPGPFLLISSAMHLPRASVVFKKAGINAGLFPCDFEGKQISNNFFEDYILPSAFAMNQWDRFIKEMAGITAYKLTGKG